MNTFRIHFFSSVELGWFWNVPEKHVGATEGRWGRRWSPAGYESGYVLTLVDLDLPTERSALMRSLFVIRWIVLRRKGACTLEAITGKGGGGAK